MGFYLLDADEGSVVGQFPHLYPVWIAIGYGVNGFDLPPRVEPVLMRELGS